jgi:hypothetical protein
MAFHQTSVAAWMPITVISSKNPEHITLLPLLPNKRETYFANLFLSTSGSVPWQVEAVGDVQ